MCVELRLQVCGFFFFLCLCCMQSLNPLLLDMVQCRNLCQSSQITLLPLSPLPLSFFSPLPFSSSYLLFTSSVPVLLSDLPLPLLCSCCLLSSSVLLTLILQPLMTCLKPTGSTVREGTAALPSHRPSQRAAALGKVHTHTCAH